MNTGDVRKASGASQRQSEEAANIGHNREWWTAYRFIKSDTQLGSPPRDCAIHIRGKSTQERVHRSGRL